MDVAVRHHLIDVLAEQEEEVIKQINDELARERNAASRKLRNAGRTDNRATATTPEMSAPTTQRQELKISKPAVSMPPSPLHQEQRRDGQRETGGRARSFADLIFRDRSTTDHAHPFPQGGVSFEEGAPFVPCLSHPSNSWGRSSASSHKLNPRASFALATWTGVDLFSGYSVEGDWSDSTVRRRYTNDPARTNAAPRRSLRSRHCLTSPPELTAPITTSEVPSAKTCRRRRRRGRGGRRGRATKSTKKPKKWLVKKNVEE